MIDVLGSLALILASVVILAVVTDRFFIPSLDAISTRLKLSDEVAGASLMAMGSSAPELAIALMALFSGGGQHSDVGIGTIVGSAVFNILVITGVSAVVAGGLHIHVYAVRRDIFYYLVSIGYLALVFFDGHVSLIEAVLGLVGYFFYLVFLALFRIALVYFKKTEDDYDEVAAGAIEADEHESAALFLWHRFEAFVAGVLGRLIGPPDRNFVWAFVVSIALIIALSYILVEATIVFSAGIGIPPVIVALTLLAAGTSAPDLIASVDVARAGRGGMAVANAVGSNTFDLLIGLALPWTVALAFQGLSGINVGTGDLWISIGILVATTLILFVFLETKRDLSRREGWILLLLYAVFVIYTLASGTAV
ncbi:MAG: calcium/sodium antiporter [Chloroflexi bacterium]|nr:calcium/sodium antiporter [Chloroflexota bacterium]